MYKDFYVGYSGDFAAVTCQLVNPRVSESSCPNGEHRRKTFLVVTNSDLFNIESIGDRIDSARELGLSADTVDFLKKAQAALADFISQNGNTNPAEAVDWAEDAPILGMRHA